MNIKQHPPLFPVETIQWTPESVKEIGAKLEGSSPETVMRWGIDNFGPGLVMATGFGSADRFPKRNLHR